MFHKRQGNQKTLNEYANRLRNSARRVDMSESKLLYAFVSGLKGKLANFVHEKKPTFLESTINKDRLAEMSLGDQVSGDAGCLSNQVSEIKKLAKT